MAQAAPVNIVQVARAQGRGRRIRRWLATPML
jgi:hypothetical protein